MRSAKERGAFFVRLHISAVDISFRVFSFTLTEWTDTELCKMGIEIAQVLLSNTTRACKEWSDAGVNAWEHWAPAHGTVMKFKAMPVAETFNPNVYQKKVTGKPIIFPSLRAQIDILTLYTRLGCGFASASLSVGLCEILGQLSV